MFFKLAVPQLRAAHGRLRVIQPCWKSEWLSKIHGLNLRRENVNIDRIYWKILCGTRESCDLPLKALSTLQTSGKNSLRLWGHTYTSSHLLRESTTHGQNKHVDMSEVEEFPHRPLLNAAKTQLRSSTLWKRGGFCAMRSLARQP